MLFVYWRDKSIGVSDRYIPCLDHDPKFPGVIFVLEVVLIGVLRRFESFA